MKKKSHRNYALNNQVLEQVPSNPYLGLQISEDLKWKEHINNVTKKHTQHLAFCTETYNIVPANVEKQHKTWDPYTKQEITKLESIQRRGARFITKDYKSRKDGTMARMLNELDLRSKSSKTRSSSSATNCPLPLHQNP